MLTSQILKKIQNKTVSKNVDIQTQVSVLFGLCHWLLIHQVIKMFSSKPLESFYLYNTECVVLPACHMLASTEGC